MIVGYGDYRYETADGWGKGADGQTLGIASGVAIDSKDRVYVIDREPSPAIVVFDRDGCFLKAWGQDELSVPHEIWIDTEDRAYIADCGDHTVWVCSTEGVLLQRLGLPNVPGKNGRPFNQPTCAVRAPSGEIYVSDGYGQYHMHRYSAYGTLLHTWGGRGAGPGQFSLPHNVCIASDGRVLVADREPNHRIQVFEADGKFVTEWPGRPTPCGLHIDTDDIVYIAEGGCVSIFTMEGRLLSNWVVTGGPDNVAHSAHGICVDHHGDIYVCEVGVSNLFHKYIRV